MIIALPFTAAALTGAGEGPEPPQTQRRDSATGQSDPVQPGGIPESDAAMAAAAAIRGFTADFYRNLALGGEPRENLVCSPYSVAVALAMTRTGASGVTASEMDTVLHAPAPAPEALNAGIRALDQFMIGGYRDHDGDGTKRPKLAIANSLWPRIGLPIEPAFLEALARYYGAGVRQLDFAGATEAARREINTWVSERTNGKIPELLVRGVLTPEVALVIANAIYLRASWEFPFDPGSTSPGEFVRDDGRVVQSPMMAGQPHEIGYQAGDGWVAVDVPYVGSQLAMAIVIPKRGPLRALDAAVDAAWLTKLLAGFSRRSVALRLPKWTFRLPVELSEILMAMGMPAAFGPRADFSGIVKNRSLHIDKVIHETFVSVDEKGTEAAAATAVIIRENAGPSPVRVVADRPFLYVIHDVATGTPLFVGRMGDPSPAT